MKCPKCRRTMTRTKGAEGYRYVCTYCHTTIKGPHVQEENRTHNEERVVNEDD